ncbi:hypothetical protein [Gemmatimonas sp.]
MPTLLVNGTDIADLGFVLTDIQPWLSGPKLVRALTALPGFTGAIPAESATVESRLITATSLIEPPTFAARLSLLDGLADLAMHGMNELVFPDAPDRIMRGLYLSSDVEVYAPRLVSTDGRVTVGWVCPDAAKYDRQPKGIVLGTTPKAIPLGTLPSGGIWRIMGPLSGAITLQYRAANGVLLGELTVTGTLTTGEHLDVDLTERRITKWSNVGVATSAYSWKASTSYWFRLDAGDGTRGLDQWGTLQQSVAAGGGLFLYRRAWAH